MKLSLSTLKTTMTDALKAKGYSHEDIPFIINMYLGGELRGHTSHGLASFATFVRDDFSQLEKPEILKATHSLFLIDAKSNSGNIIGKQAADEAIQRAKTEGVGTAIVKNMDSWLRPGAIAEYIADQDLVAYVINTGGGAAIAPPGGYDPVTGTNPIAYGIPTNDGPLVVDMATSKRAWGQVRLANKYGTDLPADTFYDNEGNITIDPKKAASVMAAGGYKGFSLALMVEMLCGSLVGMPMMNINTTGGHFGDKMSTRGGMIIAINPAFTDDLQTFKSANSDLIHRIKSTNALKGEAIRIPGEHAAHKKDEYVSDDTIEISEEVWGEIKSL